MEKCGVCKIWYIDDAINWIDCGVVCEKCIDAYLKKRNENKNSINLFDL